MSVISMRLATWARGRRQLRQAQGCAFGTGQPAFTAGLTRAAVSEDAAAAGLGREVGVVAGRGVVLGRCAFAGVGRSGVVGVLVVAVGDGSQSGEGAGGDAEVVEEVAVVVAVGCAGDAALADPAVV